MISRFKIRFAATLWLAGMVSIALVAIFVIPSLVAGQTLPLPLWAISAISFAQGGVFLALTVWAGCALAPTLGLRAPVFEALAGSTPVVAALRPLLVPGLLGGFVGGAFLIAITYAAPPELAAAAQKIVLPLSVRILYGGITEELLLRWGVMSLILWLLWRFIQRSPGQPTALLVWVAIVGSAVLFGVGHLPAAQALVGSLTFQVVVFVVVGNAAFGALAGWLFWRFGLESAMLAHAVAHVVAYAAGQ